MFTVELLLHEDNPYTGFTRLVDKRLHRSGRRFFAVCLDRELRQPVLVGKISQRRMVDNECTVRQRIEHGVQDTSGRIDLGRQRTEIRFVVRSMRRVDRT